jgi:hypothetical protein
MVLKSYMRSETGLMRRGICTMTHTDQYLRIGGLTVALVTLLFGCKPAVTGQNAMPDNPNLSPAQNRQAMVQWHQQHDKRPADSTPQSGQ